ncbi:MAG: hypothetical protein SFY67_09715 [Candidatus Melainabacteria bacterium]|nr:hypothetical protein [Candidatus Melainabacteria bacterium]
MGDFFKMLIALALIFTAFVFVTGRGGLDKTRLVKSAEASAVVQIRRVVPISQSEQVVGIKYPLKVEAELLEPITGELPSFMYLYMQRLGPSSSADIMPGKAVVFVNKDEMGRLTLEKGPQDVFAITDDKIWWSRTNKFIFVRRTPVNEVKQDIRSITVGNKTANGAAIL